MKSQPHQPKSHQKDSNGCVGVGLCLFASVFLVIGLGVAFKQAQFWTWKTTPCQIESFEISHSQKEDSPFKPEVSYTYRWDGQSYQGTRYSISEDKRWSDYEELVETEQKISRRGTCYVNTNKPEEAILERSSGGVWFGLIFALFGALFLAIGLAVVRGNKERAKAISATASKSEKITNGPVAYLFFGIFALVGLGIFSGLVLPTARTYLSAKSWDPTPATVIWSNVRSHDSDDGTTYSPDIFYRYRYRDESHRSNRYSLVSGSSSGYDAKKKIVANYPKGHQFTCYVNPKKPWQALVKRELGWFALLGLLPLPFIIIGGGGLWWAFVKGGSHRASALKMPTRTQGSTATASNTVTSLPKTSSSKGWGKFLGHLFFALFWCGVVSIFVVMAWGKWTQGNPDWFLNLFLIPFVLIGLAALFSLPYTFVAIFSPRFEFALRDPVLKPGLATKFRWQQAGGSGQLTKLTLTLFGQEEATYRQGTDTSTAHSLFYSKELFTTFHRPEIMANECDLIFPSDALPTLDGTHNKIRWFIKMHAEVKGRPDVREEVALTLHPFEETDFR